MLIELPSRYHGVPYRIYKTEKGDKLKFEIYNMTTGMRDFLWIMKDKYAPTVIDTLVDNIIRKTEMRNYEDN